MHTVIKKASRKRILCIACVHAGLIQRNRVEACEHSDIRKDRHIVFTVAVAVRGNVDHQIDMEIRAPIQNRLGILGDFHIKFLHRGRILVVDGIKIAGSEATAASDTSAVVNGGTTVFIKRNRSVGTVLCTGPAAYTAFLIDRRFPAVVHLHLSGTGTASHSDIFEGTAKSGCLMSLEMIQRNEDVRIHNGSSDLRIFHKLTALHRYIGLVRTFQSVGDDDLTSGRKRGKSIFVGTFDMLQSIFSASYV